MSASLDVRDALVDFERFGECLAGIGAHPVLLKAAKVKGNKIGMIGMLLPNAVTKSRHRDIEANGGSRRAGESYSMEVIVLLTLSASAIATPPSEPSSLVAKLHR